MSDKTDGDKKLKEYYKRRGILKPPIFAGRELLECECPHYPECKEVTEKEGLKITFVGGALVGSKYWRTSPRLLFISLDSGGGDEDDGLSKDLLGNRPKDFTEYDERTKRKHWYQTHDFATEILKAFYSDMEIKFVRNHIAHANAAKCTQNRKSRAQASDALFINCRENLFGEVEILNPDIIVTQGDKAFRSLEAAPFPLVGDPIPVSAYMPGCSGKFIRVIEINSKEVLWLHIYHPGARGGRWWKQKESTEEFVNIIRRWWHCHRSKEINELHAVVSVGGVK